MRAHPNGPPLMPGDRGAQLEALAAMFGTAEPLPAPAGPLFTAVPGEIAQTPRDGLAWIPPRWPEWAPPAAADAETLHVFIDDIERIARRTLHGPSSSLPDDAALMRSL
jgi:hypothetical protein